MVKDLLTKRPFARIQPTMHFLGALTTDPSKAKAPMEQSQWQILTQSDFLREYYPSGHRIHDPEYYPDLIKVDDKGKFYKQKIFRVAIPFQQIIVIQRLVHLCGNDIAFELTDTKADSKSDDLFLEFQQGWLDHQMEIAFYDFVKSILVTGDGAVAFFMHDGKVRTRALSFLNGDTLYPHYDSVTGELSAFARKFSDYDEKGEEVTTWVEVWDKDCFYQYRQSKQGFKGAVNAVKDFFGLDGYTLVGKTMHGFGEVPVAYYRSDDGPAWASVQDNIDQYEVNISYLAKNNKAYAFPIMKLKGDNVEIEGDMYGSVKAIKMDSESDASYLENPNASESFRLENDILRKSIFLGAFIVEPPEIKSGDLPGVAIKLIYSPSLEIATTEAKNLAKPLDAMKRLFLKGYGIETAKVSRFSQLKIFAFIKPYIHQNAAELVSNLVAAVNSQILSKQSASELTGYDKNCEWDRIMKEMKEEQSMDILYQGAIIDKQAQANSETDAKSEEN